MNYSKDVRLPVQLQRAMAAEAEAAREARAKVRRIERGGILPKLVTPTLNTHRGCCLLGYRS